MSGNYAQKYKILSLQTFISHIEIEQPVTTFSFILVTISVQAIAMLAGLQCRELCMLRQNMNIL